MKLVMFDFDGVLVDTAELSFSISSKIYPGLKKETWRTWFYGNMYQVEEIKKDVHDGVPMEENPFFKVHGPLVREMSLIEGMKAMIEDLSSQTQLAVVSSGPAGAISDFLERNGVADRFGDVLGAEADLLKTAKIKSLQAQYSIDPAGSVLITDTLGDIREASQTHTSAIGVTWGIHTREELSRGTPSAIVDTVEELRNILL